MWKSLKLKLNRSAHESALQLEESSGMARTRLSRRWRLKVDTETLLLAFCVYFVAFLNGPFWRRLFADRPLNELGDLSYGVAVGIALVMAHFVLLAPFMNRWTAKPLLATLVVVAAGASYFMGQYGIYLDISMARNVLRTDLAEAGELVTLRMMSRIALWALPPLLLLLCVTLRERSFARSVGVRIVAITLAGMAGIGTLSLVFKDLAGQMRNHKELRYLVAPANVVYGFTGALVTDARVAHRPRQPVGTDAHLGASWGMHQKPVLFIVVVGETARAANWGLSGKSLHNTTPNLARRDVINFNRVTSCGTNTEVSLPCMFSPQGRRNYDEDDIKASESLLHVIERAGLRVGWADNQSGCKGVCAGLPTWRPDSETTPALCDRDRCVDEVLLKGADVMRQQLPGSLVVVLHQLGNHGPAYYRRYPARFGQFKPSCDTDDLSRCTSEEVRNAYDNALLYTDYVLARTIDSLQQLEGRYDTAMIYISDHGESLGEHGLFLHGMPYAIAPPEQTDVPMVMWFSSSFALRIGLDVSCLRARAREPATHDHLFSTVLSLLDIRTQARDASFDLTAGCRKP